jgi:acetyl esterase/lipase
VSESHDLDPHWSALLGDIAADRPRDTVSRLRDELKALTANLPRAPVDHVEDITVAAGKRHTRCRVYLPARPRIAVLGLYFHGGGWVAGDLDTHDPLCRHIVHHSSATIIAVDYPLAPEHPYPAAFDAALAIYRWVRRNLYTFGLSRETAIALLGDSSGANLATALTLTLTAGHHEPVGPAGLIVTHPVLRPASDAPSHTRYGTGYGLTSRRLEQFWRWYAPLPAQRHQWTAAPLLAPSFAGFPPTWVQTAQFDPARSDGEHFVERLRNDGVEVRLTCYRGQIHGFQTAFDRVPAAAESLREIATNLTTLGNRTGRPANRVLARPAEGDIDLLGQRRRVRDAGE